MDTLSLPIIPGIFWILATALTVVVLIVMFGFYVYQRQRLKAVVRDANNVASLAAQCDMLKAKKDELIQWMNEQKAELDRLTAEREEQERLRAELNRLEQECASKDQHNQILRNEVGELENQRYLLTQTLEKLEKEIEDLESKKAETENIKARLTELKKTLHDVSNELDQKRREHQDVLRSINEHYIKLEELTKQKIFLEKSIADLIEESRKVRDEAERARKETKDTKEDLKKISEQCTRAENELQRKRDELARLEIQLRAYQAEIHSLKGEIDRTKVPEAEDSLRPYADLLEVQPDCLSKKTFPAGPMAIKDEIQALQAFKDRLREENLNFSERVIEAFHTCLKCHHINPLTVLAGVSGTGKTLLPMYYARMMGMHSLVMSVQPRWDSPQDMFGFYNYLEKKYKATELSRALIRMDQFNYKKGTFPMLDGDWTRGRILLVLLDEMNLARTEYYFSDFLSKLELRRLVKNPENETDRQQAEITLDTGPEKAVNFRIWVGNNVLFVGTMNEDETTQTLSDKVLDRANVLRFGKPDNKTKASQINIQEQEWPKKYLSYNQWKSWIKEEIEHAPWSEHTTKWTNRLNDALDHVGRPFGYRVQQAIATYVANYPLVEENERYKLAFADQLEQKIIPKLRGMDLGDNAANICLDEVESVIAELGDQQLADAFRNARDESQVLGMFQWRGVTRPLEDNR
ncbi:MAG: AAA family ATPase [Deltaproteobacteria bacterium]|nr:AAA family ATPase [Deltaproteobacteria bacterium]